MVLPDAYYEYSEKGSQSRGKGHAYEVPLIEIRVKKRTAT